MGYGICINSSVPLKITGGTIENTSTDNTANAIYVREASIFVESQSPAVIKSNGMAMNKAPILNNTIVKTAAADINGVDGVETYNPNNIIDYKYLEFVPVPTYEIIYNPGTHGNGSQQTDKKTQDKELLLRDAIFNRYGYTQTKTGDSSHMIGWMIALLASLLGILAILGWRKGMRTWRRS